MSNDIWHKADEAPRYRFQCVYYHRNGKDYYFGEYDATFRVFLGKKTFHQDEVWKFAFAEDVIACLDELERTRKALDVANEKLRHCVNITVEELDELKRDLGIAWNALVHFSKDPIANNALKKITALEQKDV